jgi:hypothetical protein
MTDETDNSFGDFLTGLRDSIASGNSVYGDPASPKAQAKLQELDAKIALGRQLGEILPAEEPWSVERAARERLAAEFPSGDPDLKTDLPEQKAERLNLQFDRLSGLSTREQANLAQQVADDFANRTSAVSVPHSRYNRERSGYPTGSAIVEALIREAEPAVNALAEPSERQKVLKLLRLDRQLLELMAVRGQGMTAYAARKRQLGLS